MLVAGTTADATMCLILFALHSHPELPLVLAANREERHSRATAALAPWTDEPDILAGRDLEAGGTWLGLHRSGRFAAITNLREGIPTTPALRSRGELTHNFLRGAASAEAYARHIHAERAHYAGFNLLIGDRDGLWYCATDVEPRPLPPGIYGLSNGLLDTPWPKVVNGKAALQRALESTPTPANLLTILADRRQAPDHELPDTGIGLDFERVLSSSFITGNEYGTRASTALLIDREGIATLHERSFGPGGVAGATADYRWPLAAIPC